MLSISAAAFTDICPRVLTISPTNASCLVSSSLNSLPSSASLLWLPSVGFFSFFARSRLILSTSSNVLMSLASLLILNNLYVSTSPLNCSLCNIFTFSTVWSFRWILVHLSSAFPKTSSSFLLVLTRGSVTLTVSFNLLNVSLFTVLMPLPLPLLNNSSNQSSESRLVRSLLFTFSAPVVCGSWTDDFSSVSLIKFPEVCPCEFNLSCSSCRFIIPSPNSRLSFKSCICLVNNSFCIWSLRISTSISALSSPSVVCLVIQTIESVNWLVGWTLVKVLVVQVLANPCFGFISLSTIFSASSTFCRNNCSSFKTFNNKSLGICKNIPVIRFA